MHCSIIPLFFCLRLCFVSFSLNIDDSCWNFSLHCYSSIWFFVNTLAKSFYRMIYLRLFWMTFAHYQFTSFCACIIQKLCSDIFWIFFFLNSGFPFVTLHHCGMLNFCLTPPPTSENPYWIIGSSASVRLNNRDVCIIEMLLCSLNEAVP